MVARAGWAEIEITPPLGLPMGGRGPRFAPGAEVLDPLMAQALVLEDGAGTRQVWVSLDLIGMDQDRAAVLRQSLAALTGADHEGVVLNFSHIHSGPMANFYKYPPVMLEPAMLTLYHRALASAIRRVTEDALALLQPVCVTSHRGASHVGINRRLRRPSGEVAMAPNPDGFHSPDVWVLDLRTLDGARHAVVFSYGCHPVIVYGFAWGGISAGYPGAARASLRGELGAGTHCQFVQGLAGNVRPRVLARLESGVFRKSTPEDVIQAGSELAGDVAAALGMGGEELDLSLRAVAGWVHPRFDQSRLMPLAYWREMAEREDELSRNVGRHWAERVSSGRPMPVTMPMEIGMLQLAEGHRVAWLDSETCAEWLPALREWLDDLALGVWGYCQSVSTYLPTDALLPEGGYEVAQANRYHRLGPAPFAPGIDGIVREGFLSLAQRL